MAPVTALPCTLCPILLFYEYRLFYRLYFYVELENNITKSLIFKTVHLS